ncbi:tryptophan-rich sensory protein [Salimicrobium halophilum]|uniref:TspO and MBR related proteins n=1 Tax=Salimicrobium halophilum TaxID=86666 RepID=A0A1G8SVV1_9BACI|nr:tryptophan-rich sensory protein [Salimicrobium halophilum]SDJ33379.1 hypothetical protein SAMN04490247_1555 [Salimicrobium halophilum]
MKKKLFIMYIAFFVMVAMNVLANILPLNGYTTGEVSNMYTVYFTPAGFTFSIWSIIYLSLFYWLLTFTLKKQELTNSLFLLFLLTCLFNISWIVLWHFLFDGIALLNITLHLLSIYALYQAQRLVNPKRRYVFPISIYLGWIIVATLTNAQYWLVASVEISSLLHWIIAYAALVLVGLAGVYFLKIEKNVVVPFVFIWSAFGIAIKNYSENLLFTLATFLLLIFLTLAILNYLIAYGRKK